MSKYLALGSNLGDLLLNLEHAIQALAPDVLCENTSNIYQTTPWGYTDQPDFLNQVIEVSTDLSPEELLVFIQTIEKDMGRETNIRFGPRLIDIDILFYDQEVIDQKGLQIPHPRLHHRAFVLVPLNEIAHDYIHPVNGLTLAEMLEKVDAEGVDLFSDGKCCQPIV